MDKIMPLITKLGGGVTIWMFLGIGLALSKKYRIYGIMIICSLVLCFVVGNLTLKPLIARTRPFDVNPLISGLLVEVPKDFSFPSGRTMCSFAPAVILFYMNHKIGSAALILSSLIGFLRLYLYVHYPADVFCGMIIGIFVAIITIILFKSMLKI